MNFFKTYKNKFFLKKSGKLIPITFNKNFPIKAKRIFIIIGKKNEIRGEHAHKKCYQFFFCLNGAVEISLKNPKIESRIFLSNKSNKSLLITPKVWCKIKFLEKNSIILVICNREYEFNDYIEKYDELLKFFKK